jgi:hypothetical protein
MTGLSRRNAIKGMAALVAAGAMASQPGDWTPAVEIRHEDELCVAYQARLDGEFLVVKATLGPGWHTFAMDNKRRAEEKLAGQPPLSLDQGTEITPATGLQTVGPWYQSPPKDFSHPELRWFSWGFDGQAMFAAKFRRSGAAKGRLALRGQACTATVCKNINVAISLPLANADPRPTTINLKDLVQVR